MPYSEWDEVNEAIQGIEPRVTLAQANVIAEWADAMADAEDGPENPWAAAIARFKEVYEVKGGAWVKREVEGMEFLSGELALAEGQPVAFLRVGTFVDMHGNEVEITEAVLDQMVSNFEAGAAGQEVPVDVRHEKAEAAGWLTRVWREGDRLLARVDWNSVGEELIGDRVYQYLSATIDMARGVLKSISLVNFPAVKGLPPVELEEGCDTYVYSEPEEGAMPELNEQEMADLRAQVRDQIEAEMAAEQATIAELRERIEGEVRAELESEMSERQELVAFAEGLCGDEGVALSKSPEEVVAFLEGLPTEARAGAKAMLQAKVVEFGERGSSGKGEHEDGVEVLSAPMLDSLRDWMEAGESVEAFFELNADVLGAMTEYDLSEFEERE